MKDIINKIDKEIANTVNEIKKDEEKVLFYKDLFEELVIVNLSNMIDMNHSELAVAIIINQEPSLSVNEVKQVVYGNKKIFEQLDNESIRLIALIADLFNADKDFYEETRKDTILDKKTIFKKENEIKKDIKTLIKILGTTPQEFFEFFDAFMKYDDAYLSALTTVAALREIEEKKKECNAILKEVSEEKSVKLKTKTEEKWISEYITKIFNIDSIVEPAINAKREYDFLVSKKKKLLKEKQNYDQLKNKLSDAISHGEIKNIESFLKKITNNEIRISILKFIYSHNQKIHNHVLEEYKKLSENNELQYKTLLSKYGISIENCDLSYIMRNSVNDLEIMLKSLMLLNIESPNELLSIIKESNLDTVNFLKDLSEKGIITNNLLINHKELFNNKSTEYINFIKNLGLINEKKINPYCFNKAGEVLLESHQKILENFKILEEYNLLSSIKNVTDYSFLAKEDLSTAIDTILELGFEKQLEENIEILNHKDKFNRLKIMKLLNIQLENITDINDILTTTKFYLPDDEIPNYIYNALSFYLPKNIIETEEPIKKISKIDELSEFTASDRTYNFNGVLISKNKVYRNMLHIQSEGLETDRLLYSILKGSTLNDNEISSIVSCLNEQKIPNNKRKN